MFKGTKGKWEVTIKHKFETSIYSGEKRIAEVKHYNQGETTGCFKNDCALEIGLLNAQLISAAPDLLEALMSIENDDNNIPKAIWDMRNKAIAKALNEEVPND
jgi:hypothetical protein